MARGGLVRPFKLFHPAPAEVEAILDLLNPFFLCSKSHCNKERNTWEVFSTTVNKVRSLHIPSYIFPPMGGGHHKTPSL